MRGAASAVSSMAVVAEAQQNGRGGTAYRRWLALVALLPASLFGLPFARPVLIPMGANTFGMWTARPGCGAPPEGFTFRSVPKGSWIAIVRVNGLCYAVAWMPSKYLLGP